jgi:predicted Fe-Mo cluster-binding NifX family protein
MIAVTVKENIKNSLIESCFGKSEYFFIYNIKTGKSSFLKNHLKELNKNSGKKAALLLIKKGVKTVFSSNFGIQVKKLFDKHKIQMVIISEGIKTLNQINRIK